MNSLLATTPVPRDLPLPLPLPEWALVACLIIFFLIHILFVNLMVGGSVLVVAAEWLGLRERRWNHLAQAIASTITVNKSLAVVMGIGPLLCINLLYTIQWYSANTLTGHAWLLIIPLVTIAFLLTYLHKYTWDPWISGRRKYLHLAIGVLAMALFLFIPFIFMANVNLMLFPSEWEKVRGFISSLKIGNVLPRYLHFLGASLAMTGLFLAGWFGRKGHDQSLTPGFTGPALRRLGYKAAAWVTAVQFLLGPLLLFTLPAAGLTPKLYLLIFSGATLGLVVTWILFQEIRSSDERIGRRFKLICTLFSIVVLAMGSGRHVYREAALAVHKQQVNERTEAYALALAEFNKSHASLPSLEQSPGQLMMNCAVCHAPEARLVGPSLAEISRIYANNPDGIVAWAMAPGKKRPDFPQMPPMAHLGEANLRKIAALMLTQGRAAE